MVEMLEAIAGREVRCQMEELGVARVVWYAEGGASELPTGG